MHQVNTCCPFSSLSIYQRLLLDEVAHVCNVHSNLIIAVLQHADRERVVEVPRSLRVYRNHVLAPQIKPFLNLIFRDLKLPVRPSTSNEFIKLVIALLGEVVGQHPVRQQQGASLGLEVAQFPDRLYQSADRQFRVDFPPFKLGRVNLGW